MRARAVAFHQIDSSNMMRNVCVLLFRKPQQNIVRFHRITAANGMSVWRMRYAARRALTQCLAINFSFECNVRFMAGQKKICSAVRACSRTNGYRSSGIIFRMPADHSIGVASADRTGDRWWCRWCQIVVEIPFFNAQASDNNEDSANTYDIWTLMAMSMCHASCVSDRAIHVL